MTTRARTADASAFGRLERVAFPGDVETLPAVEQFHQRLPQRLAPPALHQARLRHVAAGGEGAVELPALLPACHRGRVDRPAGADRLRRRPQRVGTEALARRRLVVAR